MSWHTPSADFGTHICIKLIYLVKQYPIIYSPSKESAPYPRKKRNEINQIWENIAREIGLSVEDCKRRWKGLKDVYAKIRKRRLQEGVLGINARKKWVYEEYMTFVTFPFEKPYQKALENIEEVDCNEWKMEETESNDTAEDTFNDVNNQTNIEEQEHVQDDVTIEYLDLDLEVDSVPDSEGYEVIQNLEKDDGSENRTEVQVSMLEEDSGRSTETKTRSKFRTIRPKPYQPNSLTKNKSVGNSTAAVQSSTTQVVNVSNLNSSNQIIVTKPSLKKGKNYNTVILTSPIIRAQSSEKEVSDGVSSTSQVAMKLSSFKNTKMNSSLISNKCPPLLHISPKKSSLGGVELFFQSMAQSVMNLPKLAQAEIKMEICKIVTKAEIQYSLRDHD